MLDPRIGYAGLKDDYTDDPDLLDGLEQSKVALESHFNQFYAGRASLASTTTPQSLVTDLSLRVPFMEIVLIFPPNAGSCAGAIAGKARTMYPGSVCL